MLHNDFLHALINHLSVNQTVELVSVDITNKRQYKVDYYSYVLNRCMTVNIQLFMGYRWEVYTTYRTMPKNILFLAHMDEERWFDQVWDAVHKPIYQPYNMDGYAYM